MGDGEDRFQWDPGDGNDIVDGQGGTDLLDFFGSSIGENIAVAPTGSSSGSPATSPLITMDLDGVENLAVHALGGTDTIEVGNLAGTDAPDRRRDLGVFDGGPDGPADTVVVNGTDAPDLIEVTGLRFEVLADGLAALVRIAGGEAANDTLRIQTLDGDDDVTVAPDVSDPDRAGRRPRSRRVTRLAPQGLPSRRPRRELDPTEGFSISYSIAD